MNPTQRPTNTGRVFTPGAQYWWRESDDYVMPRSNSPYEQPNGFVAVIAKSEIELEFDNSGLEDVPANLDPTNANAVGAAVSYAGRVKVAQHDPNAPRPMPVSMPNAMDDHQVKERSLAAAAEHASRNRQPPVDDEQESNPAAPPSRRRKSNA